MRCLAALTSLLAIACGGGERLVGGGVVEPGQEPDGQVLSRWSYRGCVDAAGKSKRKHQATLEKLRRSDGGVLLERRDGYAAVLIETRVADGFVLALSPDHGRPLVRHYRTEHEGKAAEVLVLRDADVDFAEDAPRAQIKAGRVVQRCALSEDGP